MKLETHIVPGFKSAYFHQLYIKSWQNWRDA